MTNPIPFTTDKGSFLSVTTLQVAPIVMRDITTGGKVIWILWDKETDSFIELPSGHDYELIGVSNTMTEEQAAMVVELFSVERRYGGKRTYIDYGGKGAYNSPIDSLNSLLRSIGADTTKPQAIIKQL